MPSQYTCNPLKYIYIFNPLNTGQQCGWLGWVLRPKIPRKILPSPLPLLLSLPHSQMGCLLVIVLEQQDCISHLPLDLGRGGTKEARVCSAPNFVAPKLGGFPDSRSWLLTVLACRMTGLNAMPLHRGNEARAVCKPPGPVLDIHWANCKQQDPFQILGNFELEHSETPRDPSIRKLPGLAAGNIYPCWADQSQQHFSFLLVHS